MMDFLVPILMVVGILLVSLVIVLVPMKWFAGKFGAGRSGYLACFSALVLPYLLTIILIVGLGIAAGILQLEGIAVSAGLGVLCLIVWFYSFIKILDTNVLRGLGIAIPTNIAVIVIAGLLGFGASILGIGGTGVATLVGIATTGTLAGTGIDIGSGVQKTQPTAPATRKAKAVRELRRHITGLCGCVGKGKPCRSEQAKVTKAMARIDQVQVPATQEEAVFQLKVRGAQCLNDAVAGQAKPTAPVVASHSGQVRSSAAQPVAAAPTQPAVEKVGAVAGASTAATIAAAMSANRNKYSYREVDLRSLKAQVGKLVRITMTDGEERADILEDLTPAVVRLRESRSRGGRLYELPIDGIARIKVLGRW